MLRGPGTMGRCSIRSSAGRSAASLGGNLMTTTTTMPTTPAAPAGPSAPPSLTPNAPLLSRLYRLTVRQYDQMIQDGVLGKRDRVELIEGLLVVKMSKKPPHVVAGKKGLRMLERVVPQGWNVAKEDPIIASD